MEFSDPRPVDEGYAVSAALGPLKNDEVVLVVHRIIAKLRGNTWNQDESEKLINEILDRLARVQLREYRARTGE